MTKKWLWYVCIGLICCSSIAYVYAKQTTGASKARTERNALIEQYESVIAQIKANGETPELTLLESKLRAKLYPVARQRVSNATIEKLANGASNIEKVEKSNAPTPTNIAGAPTVLEAAKAAYERMLTGDLLPGDKALIEANFPEPEFVRPEENPLDDNGGTWFNWTGSLAINSLTCFTSSIHADIPVAGLGNVLDVEVRITNLTHTWDGDLRIWLVGPSGAVCSLSTANGSSGDNYVNTVFDDEDDAIIGTTGNNTAPFTGTYRPEGLLSVYDGLPANGTWQLWVCDGVSGDQGTLTVWDIQILATAGGQVPELSVSQLSPCGNQEPNGAAPVSMRVSNVGPVASPATNAHFTFDNGVTTDLLAVPAIAPSSFFDVFFAVPVNLTLGAHTLKGYVDQVAGDATQTNDTAACNLNVFNCFDFTADLGLGNYTNTATLVGAGDNCALRTGQDHIYKVIVPVAGQYTFTTCASAAPWDAYMLLTTTCCGGTTIELDDDDCPTSAMPIITCRTLAAGTYYLDIEPYSAGSEAGYTLDITLCAPCIVDCQGGDIPENAPSEVADSTFMVDQDPNGGCNNNLGPLWGSIDCGETVCGNNFVWTTPNGTGYRDTDWYYFELTEWDTVTITCTAEYNALFGIYDDVETCVSTSFLISNTTTAACTTRTVKTCLAPGAYAAIVMPSFFGTGLDYAAGNVNYRLSMTCVPCTPPQGRCCYILDGAGACTINNSLECANLGGVWTSGITDCVTSPCPSGRCCYLDVNNQPACLIDQQAICNQLGGTWTSGITDCIASPCAIARCCYNDGLACENTTLERCGFLGGAWTSGSTCELNPCPLPPTNDDCQTATTVAIPEWCGSSGYFVQLDVADTTCTETTTGDGVTIPEYTSTAGDAFFTFTLTECRRIAIVASGPDAINTGHDSHLSVKDACCGATFILGNDDYGSNDSLPVFTTQGWLPATTRPLNSFGSMVAGRLPAGTYYVRAGAFSGTLVCSYTLKFYDYGPCVAPNLCEAGDYVSNLTVRRDSLAAPAVPAGYVTLRWTNTNAGDYNVWSSINPGNDGNPDGPDADLKAGDDGDWTLETLTPLSLPAGAVSWNRPAGFENYINFVVTPDCDPTPPTGRCCYVSGNEYACATNTLEQCNTLGGNWTIYLSCDCADNPCPQNGRCCYLDVNNHGACTDNLQADCTTLGGVWTAGAACATAPCEIGRCCYLDANNQGACADVQEIECDFLGGTWTAGVTCAGEPCVTAACCYNAGTSCNDLQDIECAYLGGTWFSGELCATFTCPQPPANDDCGNAITITNGVPENGDNTLATGTDPTSCGYFSDLDVWYVYTPTALTTITVTTCDVTWDLDTNLSLWDLCTGGTELACDEDDFGTNCLEWDYQSYVTYTPTTLDPIYIRVAGWNGDEGTFVLTVTQ